MNMGEKELRNCFSCFVAAAASSLASVVPQWETCVRIVQLGLWVTYEECTAAMSSEMDRMQSLPLSSRIVPGPYCNSLSDCQGKNHISFPALWPPSTPSKPD
jgi:hypothetical protein